uniref:Uncharacterized protein n=1 Tax=Chromera velia CCMP2878 TaxID=1169474 RepID=A0A0K6S5V4_9ALVE|eukprot:Cvel_14957.t2-p1 / transcript=Cvel_14957.t2 / gene=Cvel_14957 / organism=Chromera_velia_CCMP2878 / gene_product=hypothetical protein / transcript_product=hypothetical protein / location=Cvel_scaffold1085:54595-55050(-) / protein_length=152 / sequence_SO=supercontig / SO=protein_coding / is_pseudo=false
MQASWVMGKDFPGQKWTDIRDLAQTSLDQMQVPVLKDKKVKLFGFKSTNVRYLVFPVHDTLKDSSDLFAQLTRGKDEDAGTGIFRFTLCQSTQGTAAQARLTQKRSSEGARIADERKTKKRVTADMLDDATKEANRRPIAEGPISSPFGSSS